jgi:nucleoporin NUP82
MLAVFESIDLGLVSSLSKLSASQLHKPLSTLLLGNFPSLFPDPIHEDTVYVYHAFGVNTLRLGPMIQGLTAALRDEDGKHGTSLDNKLNQLYATEVLPTFTSFSVGRKSVSSTLKEDFAKLFWRLDARVPSLLLRFLMTFI